MINKLRCQIKKDNKETKITKKQRRRIKHLLKLHWQVQHNDVWSNVDNIPKLDVLNEPNLFMICSLKMSIKGRLTFCSLSIIFLLHFLLPISL